MSDKGVEDEDGGPGSSGPSGTGQLARVVNSLSLNAEAWLMIKAAGACACCAARLTGCDHQLAYHCEEHELRALMDARFGGDSSNSPQSLSPRTGENGNMIPTCTLCLGLLQPEVSLMMMPRARSSAEMRGAHERPCVASWTTTGTSRELHESSTQEDRASSMSSKEQFNQSEASVKEGDDARVTASPADHMGELDSRSEQRRGRLSNAIAECASSRGYTVSSFTITAAVPSCLAVRDAAFIVAHGDLLGRSATAEDFAATVSVKDALKLGLAASLEARLGAPQDSEADFVIDLAAKAPAAEAHAMNLLDGPGPSQPGPKPSARPGSTRWSKKRQRREQHRNPGLTVGAVKKGLSTLTEDAKERMKEWVLGLRAESDARARLGDGAGKEEEAKSGRGDEASPIEGEGRENDSAAGVPACEVEGEAEASAATDKIGDHGDHGNRGGKANAAPGSGATDTPCRAPAAVTVCCEVAIRRQPLYYWGRYTKLSRAVPQTPWMRGFFSVQEAVSEPFEAFSGCIEGILHGAGREDMDVRMLGNGRPFSLELVDSLRSHEEVTARLGSLAEAVNAGSGKRNKDGAVRVTHLRAAGPGDLPGEVQKVGEGKRKHYRCVVWVSKPVGRAELDAMCDRPELVVQQSTPLRVLHRRTLLDRPRSIYDMRADWINDHFFVLDLKTSAGERPRRARSCALLGPGPEGPARKRRTARGADSEQRGALHRLEPRVRIGAPPVRFYLYVGIHSIRVSPPAVGIRTRGRVRCFAIFGQPKASGAVAISRRSHARYSLLRSSFAAPPRDSAGTHLPSCREQNPRHSPKQRFPCSVRYGRRCLPVPDSRLPPSQGPT